ncbi:MAG: gluconate 2-dehydrogenase subunit 3 family protein [Saprospiraceae bacterium]|nr:gluconate 2-dehydrogenase subunit 3 family protein [Saprospiraceae bacterium]
MDRREAIKRTSWLLGLSVSASAMAAVLQGCTSEQTGSPAAGDAPWESAFLDQQEIDLVAQLAETILPRTATPGARDVLVHQYIDLMLHDHYQPRDQQEFLRGLQEVNERATRQHGQVFVACDPDAQKQLLETMEREAHAAMDEGYAMAERPFFITLKELTYLGYFTSEEIGEQVLSYDPIPGSYDGCIPLDEVGNVWSL